MIEDDSEEEQIQATSSINTSMSTSRTPKKQKGIFRKNWLSIDDYSSWLQEISHALTVILRVARCETPKSGISISKSGKFRNFFFEIRKKSGKIFKEQF